MTYQPQLNSVSATRHPWLGMIRQATASKAALRSYASPDAVRWARIAASPFQRHHGPPERELQEVDRNGIAGRSERQAVLRFSRGLPFF